MSLLEFYEDSRGSYERRLNGVLSRTEISCYDF